MGRILIGTSGYSYDDWAGEFYPEGLAKDERLKYYSLCFPFVELDFSYYGMPTARGLGAMADRTPEGFLFAVKANRLMTHEAGPDWKADTAKFRTAVEALAGRGRLAAVLAQFPYRFHYNDENRRYLGALCDELRGLALAVEFRSAEWYRDSVFEGLAERGAGLALVDSPELDRLPPPSSTVTSPLSYFRFHGRNAEAWWTGDNVSRYDYLYSEEELRGVAPRVKEAGSRSQLLLVAFNNHHKGQAVRNARMLKDILEPP